MLTWNYLVVIKEESTYKTFLSQYIKKHSNANIWKNIHMLMYQETFLCQETSCLNFWDEACWFLSLRFFGLLSSSLLLFPQRFGQYVLRPSSGVCRTREPSRNYWNHGGRLFWFRLPYPGTSVKYSCILLACSEDWTCNLQMIVFLEAQGTNAYNRYTMCPAGQFRVNFWVL